MESQNTPNNTPLNYTDEYLDWLVDGYDCNGLPLPFKGIRFWYITNIYILINIVMISLFLSFLIVLMIRNVNVRNVKHLFEIDGLTIDY